MPILVPAIPALFIMFFILSYAVLNKKLYQQKDKAPHKIGICFLMFLVLWTGISLVLDPNFYAQGIGGSSSYFYTSARQLGFVLIGAGISGVYGELLESKCNSGIDSNLCRFSLFNIWMVIFFLGATSATMSGMFGFLTRTTWGFYETRYINDSLMWFVELLWFFIGLVSLFFITFKVLNSIWLEKLKSTK